MHVNYGFKDTPDIPEALALCNSRAAHQPVRDHLFPEPGNRRPDRRPRDDAWRERLFAFMSRNAGSIADFLRLPNNCVIELGTRVQI